MMGIDGVLSPFRPESIGSLSARYPAALERLYDSHLEAMLLRENIFDFEHGLRLVVTLEFREETGGPSAPYLHIGADAPTGTFLFQQILLGECDEDDFVDHAILYFKALSGSDETPEFVAWGPSGSAHFFLQLEAGFEPMIVAQAGDGGWPDDSGRRFEGDDPHNLYPRLAHCLACRGEVVGFGHGGKTHIFDFVGDVSDPGSRFEVHQCMR